MEFDIPTLGTLTLGAVLVSAAYTFAVSIAAARGRPHLLRSARFGTFATIALVATAVFLLAYAFQAHDFRIRYVARYSDRSMPPIYLWTALWGGQDGSLLWWTFLLSGYIGLFTWWVKDKYREMQPMMFAILMSVISFFVVVQLFGDANPFRTTFGAEPVDGEGLNPLLQNYWMVIHPPALYLGLTGWAIPFAFVMSALITGRLNEDWIRGVRKWVLLAWGFLTLGNILGMFWSYEELGWGGYWAWDPVENASFLPWLTATAYLHSVMIQERRGTFKVWNVGLLTGTFILTIFGTFLTRSGLIASVHSFARSDIGEYFAYYLVALCLGVLVVIGWRLPDLRGGRKLGWLELGVATLISAVSASVLAAFGVVADVAGFLGVLFLFPALVGFLKFIEVQRDVPVTYKKMGLAGGLALLVAGAKLAVRAERFGTEFVVTVGVLWALILFIKALQVMSPPLKASEVGAGRRGIESVLSREFAFLLNNWILLGMLVFVTLATTFPLLSEWLRDETVSVGPGYYNKWMVPFGLILLTLTGIGPLIAWRKATGRNLLLAFRWPVLGAAVVFLVHLLAGAALGYAPFVAWDDIYDTATGRMLAAIYSVTPLLSTTICAFVVGTVVQEFWRGTAVRVRNKKENPLLALYELVSRGRRRYGGYTVHIGIVLMFLGFTGAAYDIEEEASLMPGEVMAVGDFEFRYDSVQMEEDPNKRMIFTTLTVFSDGEEVDQVRPARFIYRSHPEMPTTEVEIKTSLTEDLYVIMSAVDPRTQRGTFRIIVRPGVVWIWIGGAIMLLGVFIAISPKLSEVLGVVRFQKTVRSAARIASLVILFGGAAWALAPPSLAAAQSDSSSSLHAGTVEIHDPDERRLFSRLLCECGDCQRLPLSTCGCSWADGMRAELRGRLAQGEDANFLISDYRDRFGAQAIAIPSDEGLDRALWAVPMAAIGLAALSLGFIAVRWQRAGAAATQENLAASTTDEHGDGLDEALDAQLDDELDALEGD